jgi:hypothetical protein
MGLIDEAHQDFQGRCCAHQLVHAVRKRDRTTDRRNAQPVFILEDVEILLDDLQFELYPGHYQGRPAPVVSEAVKQELAAQDRLLELAQKLQPRMQDRLAWVLVHMKLDLLWQTLPRTLLPR